MKKRLPSAYFLGPHDIARKYYTQYPSLLAIFRTLEFDLIINPCMETYKSE